MNPNKKNRVMIFSGPNFLAVSLLEYLLSRNFLVDIYSKEITLWNTSTSHIGLKSSFRIINNFDSIEKSYYSNSICLYGFDNKEQQKFKIFSDIKTLVVAPFTKYKELNDLIPNSSYISSIYLGDLIGPRIDINSQLLINNLIKEVWKKRMITVAIGELFYPIFINDLVRELFSYLFSFGPYGKEILLLGEETSSKKIWDINKKLFSSINLKIDTKLEARRLPQIFTRKTIKSDLEKSFYETFNWLNLIEVKFKKQDKKEIKKPVNKYSKSIVKYSLMFLSVLFLLPIVSALVGGLIYYSAYKNYNESKILFARPFWIISQESSRFMTGIPVANSLYKETQFAAHVAIQLGDLYIDARPVITKTADLTGKVLGNETYNISEFVKGMDTDVEKIYLDIDLIERTVNGNYYKNVYLQKRITQNVDLPKIKMLVKEAVIFSRSTPDFLGADKAKTYLVLFQNNMELRPTGGFIGSYGLTTFEKGRLIDMTVSDVYSADGQLKGHVEPPAPIRDYLNEANWFLRDSNWDPDFIVSARRAEWFLDKELGTKVDGVFAIDLTPINDLLKVTGPIFLSDYNMDITSDNLYEKTQEEVERNFFAGSRKKASFLTSLSRNLLNLFGESNSEKRAQILRVMYDNLERRHLQIYLHDDVLQKSIEKLGWEGSVKSPNCLENCYADLAGIVEANLGVNKVNQFVTRKVDLEITFDDNYINRKLTLILNNSANPSLGPSGRYKAFIRLIRSSDAYPDFDGELVEVLPSSSKTVEYEWKSNRPEKFDPKDYKFYFRKQAGVTKFPFSLTINGVSHYNTDLDRDIFINNINGH